MENPLTVVAKLKYPFVYNLQWKLKLAFRRYARSLMLMMMSYTRFLKCHINLGRDFEILTWIVDLICANFGMKILTAVWDIGTVLYNLNGTSVSYIGSTLLPDIYPLLWLVWGSLHSPLTSWVPFVTCPWWQLWPGEIVFLSYRLYVFMLVLRIRNRNFTMAHASLFPWP